MGDQMKRPSQKRAKICITSADIAEIGQRLGLPDALLNDITMFMRSLRNGNKPRGAGPSSQMNWTNNYPRGTSNMAQQLDLRQQTPRFTIELLDHNTILVDSPSDGNDPPGAGPSPQMNWPNDYTGGTSNMAQQLDLRQQQQEPEIHQQYQQQQHQAEDSNGPAPKTRHWRDFFTLELRNYLVYDLARTMIPSTDLLTVHDKRIDNVILQARKVERDLFDMATSRYEYYHLLEEKIYKIRKEVKENPQKWQEQQMQQQQRQAQEQQQQLLQQAGGNAQVCPMNADMLSEPNMTAKMEMPLQVLSNILNHHENLKQQRQQKQQQQQQAEGSNGTAPKTKDWHNSVSPELRTYLVHDLVRAIIPALDSLKVHDGRINYLIPQMKNVEDYFFNMAKSRSEYYQLLERQIYSIQKELEERKKREEQQMQQQQQQEQEQQVEKLRLVEQQLLMDLEEEDCL